MRLVCVEACGGPGVRCCSAELQAAPCNFERASLLPAELLRLLSGLRELSDGLKTGTCFAIGGQDRSGCQDPGLT
jgi:hypothetical protein